MPPHVNGEHTVLPNTVRVVRRKAVPLVLAHRQRVLHRRLALVREPSSSALVFPLSLLSRPNLANDDG